MIHTIWKDYGETMTDVLERGRARDTIEGPTTYAGRLDPAAQGVVILLSGDDRYDKDKHLSHDKEYTFDMILGITTDTNDIFGLIQDSALNCVLPENYTETLQQLVGTHSRALPPYSGYRHQGTPLWTHAQQGNQPEIIKTTTVYSLSITDIKRISTDEIKKEVFQLCNTPSLSGFRVSEIRESWEELPVAELAIVSMKALVSSGTYIRSLVHEYGNLLGIPGCAYHITRTQVQPKMSLLIQES